MNNLLPQPRDVAVTDASEKKLYYFSFVTHISFLSLIFYKYDLQNITNGMRQPLQQHWACTRLVH